MIDMVIGMQFGSEGKGSVVSALVKQHHYHAVVRTGGPNAGHTFEFGGVNYKMRQLPCAWQAGFPLVIPAGGIVDPVVLESELTMAVEAGCSPLLLLSGQAAVIAEDDVNYEQAIGLGEKIGSTTSGTGAARAMKVMRQAELARNNESLKRFVADDKIEELLGDHTRHILVETTQGFGLSLNCGFYPQCTSTDISVHQVLADLGPFVSRRHFVRVIGVARTFPIRVAGNSGPLYKETSWDQLRYRYGSHIPTEHTTVTKHVRRVGEFDDQMFKRAVKALQPQVVYLTFCDYLLPILGQWEGRVVTLADLPPVIKDFIAARPHNQLIEWLGVGIGKFVKVAR